MQIMIRTRDEGVRDGWPSNSISIYQQRVRGAITALTAFEQQVQKLPSRFDEATQDLKSGREQRARERERLDRSVQTMLERLRGQRDFLESVDAQCLLIEIHNAKYNRGTRRWEARDRDGPQALQRAEMDVAAKARKVQAMR